MPKQNHYDCLLDSNVFCSVQVSETDMKIRIPYCFLAFASTSFDTVLSTAVEIPQLGFHLLFEHSVIHCVCPGYIPGDGCRLGKARSNKVQN